MEKFRMLLCRSVYMFLILGVQGIVLGQGNCLIFPSESGERIACELSYRAISYKQGSKESQILFDKAIEIGPNYAYAYYQKAVPYLKRGLFAEGVQLINQAIKLEPQNYLDYRAYWYYYNYSYENCMKDLEELYSVHNASYVSTPGGELEMRILLALSYAHMGSLSKGIFWMTDLMKEYEIQPHLKGPYDHFCFGMLYYMNDQLNMAEAELLKQLEIDDDFADTYYYLGLIEMRRSNDEVAKAYFQRALSKMEGLDDGYSLNLFTEFNTSSNDVKRMLKG